MVESENITKQFEGACVVQFSGGYWRAKKKLSKDKLERIAAMNPKAAQWLTGSKSLIDPVEVKKVGKIYNKVQSYLNPDNPDSPCLPFPIAGLKLIPFSLMADVDSELEKLKAEFFTESEKFLDNIDDYKSAAESNMAADGLFNELEYPQNVESKFHFSWRFLAIETPEKMKSISLDFYEKEKAKFMETLEQAKDDCVSAMRNSFADMVNHLIERFTGTQKYNSKKGKIDKEKTFRDSTIENFYDFFGQFKDRNIFDDAELQKLVKQAQDVLKGREAGIIRENDSLKNQIAGQMKGVQSAINELTKKPRRKIDL